MAWKEQDLKTRSAIFPLPAAFYFLILFGSHLEPWKVEIPAVTIYAIESSDEAREP